MTWRMPERSGSRGSSGMYKDLSGIGESPIVGAQINAGVLSNAIGMNDVPIYTRQAIRNAGDTYRGIMSRTAWYIAQNLKLEQCIGALSVLDPTIQKACGKSVSPERLLMPLGVAEMCRVPFTAKELIDTGEDGELRRAYNPTYEQRFEASLRAYLASQQALITYTNSKIPDDMAFEDYVVSDDFLHFISKHYPNSINSMFGEGQCAVNVNAGTGIFCMPMKAGFWVNAAATTRNQVQSTASAAQPLVGDVCTKNCMTRGFAFYSIYPTEDELTTQGGFYRYYARGGWIMYVPILNGDEPIQQNKLNFNNGYFQCPDGSLAASVQDLPDEGHGWLAYVKFDNPQFSIKVRMKDRSAWQSVKGAVTGAVKEGLSLICKAAPLAAAVASQTGAMKTCTKAPTYATASEAQKKAAGCDGLELIASPGTTPALSCEAKLAAKGGTGGASCTEGTPGCHCAPVVGTQYQMAAMAGASLLTAACAPGATEMPITCNQMNPPTGIPGWLMWVAGIAAAIGGAAYFTKHPK